MNRNFETYIWKPVEKEQLKNSKRAQADDAVNFVSKIIPKTNLILCRITNLSKYIRDLLDVCFGLEHTYRKYPKMYK